MSFAGNWCSLSVSGKKHPLWEMTAAFTYNHHKNASTFGGHKCFWDPGSDAAKELALAANWQIIGQRKISLVFSSHLGRGICSTVILWEESTVIMLSHWICDHAINLKPRPKSQLKDIISFNISSRASHFKAISGQQYEDPFALSPFPHLFRTIIF